MDMSLRLYLHLAAALVVSAVGWAGERSSALLVEGSRGVTARCSSPSSSRARVGQPRVERFAGGFGAAGAFGFGQDPVGVDFVEEPSVEGQSSRLGGRYRVLAGPSNLGSQACSLRPFGRGELGQGAPPGAAPVPGELLLVLSAIRRGRDLAVSAMLTERRGPKGNLGRLASGIGELLPERSAVRPDDELDPALGADDAAVVVDADELGVVEQIKERAPVEVVTGWTAVGVDRNDEIVVIVPYEGQAGGALLHEPHLKAAGFADQPANELALPPWAHSRSPRLSGRYAARARSAAAEEPYRCAIDADFQPANAIRSPSESPEAFPSCAQV